MRNLTLAVPLLAAFALLGMRYVQERPALSSPEIVASFDETHQSAPIPITTLYSPSEDGVYRISTYLAVTQPGSPVGGYWTAQLRWYDDAGQETFFNQLPVENQASGSYMCSTSIFAASSGPRQSTSIFPVFRCGA